MISEANQRKADAENKQRMSEKEHVRKLQQDYQND